jgi:hypothetical protein
MNRIEYVDKYAITWVWLNDAVVHLYVKLGCNQINDLKNVGWVVHYWLNQFGVFETGYLNRSICDYDVDKITQGIVQSGKMIVLEYTIDPSIIVYDYDKIKEKCERYDEELIQKCLHPRRFAKHLDLYNYDILCDEYYE